MEFQLLITQPQVKLLHRFYKVDNMTTIAGSIQITRLTNTLTGLSIVTFENPSGNSDETLGHGSETPEMIWTKSRDTGGNAQSLAGLS